MNLDKILTEPHETHASSKGDHLRRKHVHTATTKPGITSSYRPSVTSPKPSATLQKQPQQTMGARGATPTSAKNVAQDKSSSTAEVEKALTAEEKELERLLKGEEQDSETQLLPLPQSTPPHTESTTHPLLLELPDMQTHISKTRSTLVSQLDQYPLLMTSLTPPASLVMPLPVHHPTCSLSLHRAKTEYALKLRPRSVSTIHLDALHSIPIARMGDYQSFLRQHPWLRDPFEDTQDFNAFGSPYKLRPKSPTGPNPNTATIAASTASTPTASAATPVPAADIPAVNVEDKEEELDPAVERVDELADMMDATQHKRHHQIHLQQGWQERKGMSIQNGNKRPNLFEWVENRKKAQKIQKQQQQTAETAAPGITSSSS